MERYQVLHPAFGHIEWCETKAAAFRFAKRCGDGYQIFDRMAHRQKPECWEVRGGSVHVIGLRVA